MLRAIIIVLTLVTIAVTGYLMTVSVALPTPTFKKAVEEAGESSSEDMAKQVKIITYALVDDKHPATPQEFFCVDSEGTVFRVNYTGQEVLSPFKNGEAVDVVGHVHGGEEPYFHAKQILSKK